MAEKDDGSVPPPVGSFPGYRLGVDIFTAWANAMKAHADGWNDVWGKAIGGQLGTKELSTAFIGSIDAFTSLSQQVWTLLGGPSAPPWVTLPFPLKNTVSVQILKTVKKDFPIKDVRLVPMGPNQTATLTLQAVVSGAHAIDLMVSDAEWNKFDPQAGEYIGLVFSSEHPDPLAIVILRATQEAIDEKKSFASERTSTAILE